MLKISGLILAVGLGLLAAACQNDGMGPQGTYNNGYNSPPPRYAQQQSNPYYGNQQQPNPYYGNQQQPNPYYANQQQQQQGYPGTYNQADGRRYTTVAVTNRGQNGNRDEVVAQQVVCGSSYYDGYRNRTAPRC